MDKKEIDSDVPPSTWLAVGLLDGTWAGGKVMVTVDVISPMPKIHLVHLFAEKISKQNGFVLIDACFAYCPELDFFIPFAYFYHLFSGTFSRIHLLDSLLFILLSSVTLKLVEVCS